MYISTISLISSHLKGAAKTSPYSACDNTADGEVKVATLAMYAWITKPAAITWKYAGLRQELISTHFWEGYCIQKAQ